MSFTSATYDKKSFKFHGFYFNSCDCFLFLIVKCASLSSKLAGLTSAPTRGLQQPLWESHNLKRRPYMWQDWRLFLNQQLRCSNPEIELIIWVWLFQFCECEAPVKVLALVLTTDMKNTQIYIKYQSAFSFSQSVITPFVKDDNSDQGKRD